MWPWGEVASVDEIEQRLAERWPLLLVEATIWKIVADAAARGHLLVDLHQQTLDRQLPLALLPPEVAALPVDPFPDTLLVEGKNVSTTPVLSEPNTPIAGPTFDASTLPGKQREQFYRNLRAVEQVLAGASQTRIATESGISRSWLSHLVQRTKAIGQIACVPHGSYTRKTTMHPAFQECIRRLYLLPTQLSMTAIHEHMEMRLQRSACRLQWALPSHFPPMTRCVEKSI